MGYETKLVIGQVNDFSSLNKDGRTYVSPIATYDLSKAGGRTATVLSTARSSDEKFYYYGDDGDTAITEDRYDDQITEVDRHTLIDAMKYDNEHEYEYRRYSGAIALLESFDEGWPNDRIVVLQYGH